MVTPDENSRIIQPDCMAESLGVDAANERQRAIDAWIDEAIHRYGELAVLNSNPAKGDSFVGALNEYTLSSIMKFPLV